MDTISPQRRSENMRRIRSSNTQPEMIVRSLLHGLGYRYALHRRDLPGVPDLVFPSRKKIIFVHGCFWHLHASCVDGRIPKSRAGYWRLKLLLNVKRDRKNLRRLRRAGWKIAKVWECETSQIDSLRKRLVEFLG